MNTDQLKSFIQVAENLNFARAAEILKITQSAVSRQIHSLEDELGAKLLHLFQYKQFLVGWGGSYGNEYRHMYLLMPYLATINNLSSAVVKDANKTMKITYTLTEAASGEG